MQPCRTYHPFTNNVPNGKRNEKKRTNWRREIFHEFIFILLYVREGKCVRRILYKYARGKWIILINNGSVYGRRRVCSGTNIFMTLWLLSCSSKCFLLLVCINLCVSRAKWRKQKKTEQNNIEQKSAAYKIFVIECQQHIDHRFLFWFFFSAIHVACSAATDDDFDAKINELKKGDVVMMMKIENRVIRTIWVKRSQKHEKAKRCLFLYISFASRQKFYRFDVLTPKYMAHVARRTYAIVAHAHLCECLWSA